VPDDENEWRDLISIVNPHESVVGIEVFSRPQVGARKR